MKMTTHLDHFFHSPPQRVDVCLTARQARDVRHHPAQNRPVAISALQHTQQAALRIAVCERAGIAREAVEERRRDATRAHDTVAFELGRAEATAKALVNKGTETGRGRCAPDKDHGTFGFSVRQLKEFPCAVEDLGIPCFV